MKYVLTILICNLTQFNHQFIRIFIIVYMKALKIPGCVVMLGDRPIDITLRRAIATLSAWQKIKITFHCLFNYEKLKAEELERYKQKDVLEV